MKYERKKMQKLKPRCFSYNKENAEKTPKRTCLRTLSDVHERRPQEQSRKSVQELHHVDRRRFGVCKQA